MPFRLSRIKPYARESSGCGWFFALWALLGAGLLFWGFLREIWREFFG